MTSDPVIRAEKLSRIYAMDKTNVVGITGIDLVVFGGETLVLKGESGSGKSTLLALLAGLDHPTSGDLNVAGYNMINCTDTRLTHFRREVVGMVFQNFNLLPTLTVLENVLLPGLLAGRVPLSIKKRSTELLQWLGLSKRVDAAYGHCQGFDQ